MTDDEIASIRKKKEEMLKKIMAMPDEVLHIENPQQFNEIVEKYQDVPIILDFWAPWCGPCKAFGPTFEAAQQSDWGEHFIFAKVNTESAAGAVASALGVSGIPTVIFIKNKKEIHRKVGAMRKNQFFNLLGKIHKALQQA